MPKFFEKSPLISAAVLGFIFLIPLIALELVNRWKFAESFPFQFFTFAWILQTIFILLLIPIIKKIQSGKSLQKNPIIFILQVAGLLLIAYIWAGLIIDQWPCLMGVPNCD
jgi:hypothetical protein